MVKTFNYWKTNLFMIACERVEAPGCACDCRERGKTRGKADRSEARGVLKWDEEKNKIDPFHQRLCSKRLRNNWIEQETKEVKPKSEIEIEKKWN